MSSYKNNKDGTLTPIATNNHISQGLPQEGFVTEGELVEAVADKISTDTLKSVVAASSDFADFQTRIAAL